MKCPNCQWDSPPGTRFCPNCGQRLPAARPASRGPLVDFSQYIAKATAGFVGREWLDDEVEHFIDRQGAYRNGRGPLLIIGEPGLGKTAYLAHLARQRDCVHYFCSRLHPGWLDPARFARSLGQQLAARLGYEYGEILARQEGVHISADQAIGTLLGGQAIGVYIEYLVATGPQDLFGRLVNEPLYEYCRRYPDRAIVMAIDGLEEILAYPRRVTILDLLAGAVDFPQQVRTILTTSQDRQVMRYFSRALPFDLQVEAADRLEADAQHYIETQLARAPIQAALTANRIEPEDFTRTVRDKSEGNFLYLRLLFQSIERDAQAVANLEQVPDGLDQAYSGLLDLVVRRNDLSWRHEVRPVLGTLAVAREPLSFGQIVRFSGQERQVVQDVLDATELVLDTGLDRGEPRYGLFHSALAEILQDRRRNPSFWIDGPAFHAQIARTCRGPAPAWDQLDWKTADDYTLSHLARHLFLAGPEHFDDLYALINPSLREAKNRRFYSDESFALDVETAIEAAEQGGLAGLPRVMGLSLGLATLQTQAAFTPVPVLVMLARVGAEEEALARLNNLPPVDAVTSLCRIAALYHSKGRQDEARSLLQQAIQRAVQTQDEEAYLSAIEAVVQGCEIVQDAAWLAVALEPVIAAARRLADPGNQATALLGCALQLGRTGGQHQSRPLLQEIRSLLDQVADDSRRAYLLINLAGAWKQLDEPEHHQEMLEEALDPARAALAAEANAGNLVSILIALGRTGEAIGVAQEYWQDLNFLVDQLATGDDVRYVWGLLGDDEGHLEDRIDLARRASELGEVEDAWSKLQPLEALLDDPAHRAGDRIKIRLNLASHCRIEQPERARQLLDEALAIARACVQGDDDMPAFLDTPLEEALLQLPATVADVWEGGEAQALLEQVLTVMLDQSPLVAFWWISAEVWRVRARAAVAASMAAAGVAERARELLEQTFADIADIRTPGFRREALGVVAEALANFADRRWVESILRRILDLQSVPADSSDVEAYSQLALQMLDLPQSHAVLREIVALITAITAELGAKPDSDPDLRYHEFNEAVKPLADLIEAVDDAEMVQETMDRLWPLLADVDDLETRRDLIAALVYAWSHVAIERVEAAVESLEQPWDQAAALAALAEYFTEAGALDRATESIEHGLGQAEHLTWDDGLAIALQAVVDWIPANADPDRLSTWLYRAVLAVREQEWPAWQADSAVSAALAALDANDPATAAAHVEIAAAAAESLQNARSRALAWLGVAIAHSRAGDAGSAEATLQLALASAAAIEDATRRRHCLATIAGRMGSVEASAWLAGLVDEPAHAAIRDDMLVALAGQLAWLGAIDQARALIENLAEPARPAAAGQIAGGLAAGGMLDQAWQVVALLATEDEVAQATRHVARTLALAGQLDQALAAADRLVALETWLDALGDVAVATAEISDEPQVFEALAAIDAHLTSRLPGLDRAWGQALIAGRLARPDVLPGVEGQLGRGGSLSLARSFLEAALANLGAIEDEAECIQASRDVLLALVRPGHLDDPDVALRYLLERLDADNVRAPVMAAIALKSVECQQLAALEDSIRWLLTQETWSFCLYQQVALANWLEDWPDFASAYEEMARAVRQTLGDLVAALVEQGEPDMAKLITDSPGLIVNQVYVQARLAQALLDQDQAGEAGSLLDEALPALLGLPSQGYPDVYCELAAALTALDRIDEALDLARSQANPGDHNDVIDAVAYVLASAGQLDQAEQVLRDHTIQFDPFSLYRPSLRVHWALATIADAHTDRGELEQAAARLEQLTDPWAIAPRKMSLDKLGTRAAQLAGDEPARIAALGFDLLRKGRAAGRQDVLTCIAMFAPVLKSSDPTAAVETWHHLQAARSWSA